LAGINRALYENRALAKALAGLERPCIFLCHISVDKLAVSAIADYITQRSDIDVYFDVQDSDLQEAVRNGNPHKITAFIERGLALSTHVMCIISKDTAYSWWVPYELGFGKCLGKPLASLKLKDVTLPAYLEISEIIRGTDSLNKYLTRVRRGLSKAASVADLTESLLRSSVPSHPLDSFLNWQE
jgi:hypothetical protein